MRSGSPDSLSGILPLSQQLVAISKIDLDNRGVCIYRIFCYFILLLGACSGVCLNLDYRLVYRFSTSRPAVGKAAVLNLLALEINAARYGPVTRQCKKTRAIALLTSQLSLAPRLNYWHSNTRRVSSRIWNR